jgi:broad specificity phosphatase PhoE
VAEYFAAIAHDPLHGRVNGGESLIEHKGRVLEFLAWLRGQPHRTVLVVAHEETLRVFDAAFRGLPDESLRSLSYANGEILAYDL